jgi:transmembrane sensor
MSDKYEVFLAQDFLNDALFRSWIVDGDREATEFWTQWMKDHPEKYPDVFQAKALYHALETGHRSLSEAEIDDSINITVDSTREHVKGDRVRTVWLSGWYRYAASILLLAGLLALMIKFNSKDLPTLQSERANVQSEWLTETNTGIGVKVVQLPDGSKVVLQREASFRYKKNFSGPERRTYLTGTAFFEVSRNPRRPFLVITEHVITKVLGTSFWVHNDVRGNQFSVVVRTGKVSVIKRKVNKEMGDDSGHVILTANQSAVFSGRTNELIKTLSKAPELHSEIEDSTFVYEDALIIKVFDDLEKAYGIPIRYDRQLLRECQLTATLGKEPFFEKLELICFSIGASFRQQNGEVFIDSKGCK